MFEIQTDEFIQILQTDRKQVVVLNACSSAECNVTSGVSQGSFFIPIQRIMKLLRPMSDNLFIYVNDAVQCQKLF